MLGNVKMNSSTAAAAVRLPMMRELIVLPILRPSASVMSASGLFTLHGGASRFLSILISIGANALYLPWSSLSARFFSIIAVTASRPIACLLLLLHPTMNASIESISIVPIAVPSSTSSSSSFRRFWKYRCTWLTARTVMGLHIFSFSITTEFVLKSI